MTIHCETCGRPTQMTATKRCDGCYEVEMRLRFYLDGGGEKARAFVMKAMGAGVQTVAGGPQLAPVAPDYPDGLVLPGWTCDLCDAFNEEVLEACRCCGWGGSMKKKDLPSFKIIIVKEDEPLYSSTKVVYRARREDGSSLFMGEETQEKLIARLKDHFPMAKIVPHEENP